MGPRDGLSGALRGFAVESSLLASPEGCCTFWGILLRSRNRDAEEEGAMKNTANTTFNLAAEALRVVGRHPLAAFLLGTIPPAIYGATVLLSYLEAVRS